MGGVNDVRSTGDALQTGGSPSLSPRLLDHDDHVARGQGNQRWHRSPQLEEWLCECVVVVARAALAQQQDAATAAAAVPHCYSCSELPVLASTRVQQLFSTDSVLIPTVHQNRCFGYLCLCFRPCLLHLLLLRVILERLCLARLFQPVHQLPVLPAALGRNPP